MKNKVKNVMINELTKPFNIQCQLNNTHKQNFNVRDDTGIVSHILPHYTRSVTDLFKTSREIHVTDAVFVYMLQQNELPGMASLSKTCI